MSDNEKDLTATCKSHVSEMNQLRKRNIKFNPLLTKSCANEKQIFCKNIPSGKGRILSCLKANSELNKERYSLECIHAIKIAKISPQYDNFTKVQTKASLAAQEISEESREWIVLTGWVAFAAMASLVVVVLGVSYKVFSKSLVPHKGYTVVINKD